MEKDARFGWQGCARRPQLLPRVEEVNQSKELAGRWLFRNWTPRGAGAPVLPLLLALSPEQHVYSLNLVVLLWNECLLLCVSWIAFSPAVRQACHVNGPCLPYISLHGLRFGIKENRHFAVQTHYGIFKKYNTGASSEVKFGLPKSGTMLFIKWVGQRKKKGVVWIMWGRSREFLMARSHI